MFDWFRKNKKTEPEETPAIDELSQPDDESGALSSIQDEIPPTEAERLSAVDQSNVADNRDQAEEALPEPEQADEAAEGNVAESEAQDQQPAKKGFFARFREKFSAGEASPAPSDQADKSEEEETPAAAEPEAGPIEGGGSEAAISEADLQLPEESITEEADDSQAETDLADFTDQLQPAEEERETILSAADEPEAEAQTEDMTARIQTDSDADLSSEEIQEEKPDENDDVPQASQGLFSRFKEKLSATRNQLAGRIESLLSSVRSIDDDLLDELEELLITSDLGIKTTEDLLYKIRGQVASKELSDVNALKLALKKRIREMVDLPHPPRPKVKPLVIMVVGINGVGKTTTIAKLARRFKEEEGQKVLLAAGDTFRSAAVDQLIIWSERLGVDIISQPTGADASAVVFDALTAAQARGSDVVIIDTAGRLHTKVNLMDELKKIKRVGNKALPGAPHHTILVLDGNTGQNAQRQAQTFHEAVGIDSIIVTKLDGTAKGGVIVSISNELKIPISFVGLGESFEDLQPFDPEAFTDAILPS